jgi:geranylgeranyl diphosphate synthase type II
MYIKALELGTPAQQKSLKDLFSLQPQDPTHKIAEVKALFEATGAAQAMQASIVSYTDRAFEVLDTMAIEAAKKQLLKDFGVQLMERSS